MVLVNLNPKPDYEYYRSKGLNKSYKGVPRGTPGITFEAFDSRILSLQEH